MLCVVHRLGLVAYQEAWDLQNRLAQEVAEGKRPATLLLLEHSHTYTFGRRGLEENLLWDQPELERRGVDVHWVDRGGDVTYHGPGQLVGYPLLPLAPERLPNNTKDTNHPLPTSDYIAYLRKLEQVLIKTLAQFGLVAGQINNLTGVWIQAEVLSRCKNCPPDLYKSPAKIASIGIKVDARGISRHGFALNVNPDMDYWEGINACGLENQNKVSMENLMDLAPSFDEVSDIVVENFAKIFAYKMQTVSSMELT
ncbi:MAG: lipoyl(octanoyl) transferase LipB [Chloroflexi bacterium]|nr:lipoyl(octanoyl) transferase LipB [Chloroflexota bacterium]